MNKDIKKFLESSEDADSVISISPIEPERVTEEAKKALLELQLLMATSSINHEYARMEFEDVGNLSRRDELLEYMNDCREQYFKARKDLEKIDSYAVAEFEKDLMRQKKVTLNHYNA